MIFRRYMLPAFVCAALACSAHASHLNIVNENKKELSVKIEPEGDTNASFKQTISAEQHSSIDLNASQLNGKSHFSIKGDTSVFTPGGKCEHLSIDKDYKITFQNDKAGTTCLAEEDKKSTTEK